MAYVNLPKQCLVVDSSIYTTLQSFANPLYICVFGLIDDSDRKIINLTITRKDVEYLDKSNNNLQLEHKNLLLINFRNFKRVYECRLFWLTAFEKSMRPID